jgi:hypothetical protein
LPYGPHAIYSWKKFGIVNCVRSRCRAAAERSQVVGRPSTTSDKFLGVNLVPKKAIMRALALVISASDDELLTSIICDIYYRETVGNTATPGVHMTRAPIASTKRDLMSTISCHKSTVRVNTHAYSLSELIMR